MRKRTRIEGFSDEYGGGLPVCVFEKGRGEESVRSI